MAKPPCLQVCVDQPLKERLENLARAQGLSVSSYLRVLINHHILALDRQSIRQSEGMSLQAFYDAL